MQKDIILKKLRDFYMAPFKLRLISEGRSFISVEIVSSFGLKLFHLFQLLSTRQKSESCDRLQSFWGKYWINLQQKPICGYWCFMKVNYSLYDLIFQNVSEREKIDNERTPRYCPVCDGYVYDCTRLRGTTEVRNPESATKLRVILVKQFI